MPRPSFDSADRAIAAFLAKLFGWGLKCGRTFA